MSANISWTNYTIVTILLLAAYYLFIGIRFYLQDLRYFLSNNLKPNTHPSYGELENDTISSDVTVAASQEKSKWSDTERNDTQVNDDPFQEIEQLIIRLKEVIAGTANKKCVKEEFIRYIQLILKEYPDLKSSPFQPAISELIVSECEKYGFVTLSEEEVVLFWNKVV